MKLIVLSVWKDSFIKSGREVFSVKLIVLSVRRGECSLFGRLVQLIWEGGTSKWRQSRLLIKKGKD